MIRVSLNLLAVTLYVAPAYNSARAQAGTQTSTTQPLSHSIAQTRYPGVFDVDVKLGALGRTSDSTGGSYYNTNGTVGGTTALVGVGIGVRLSSKPAWSFGLRGSVLFPLSTATSQYIETKLLTAGTIEAVVGKKLGREIEQRPVTVYGTFGAALGLERESAAGSLDFADTEPLLGYTGKAGGEMALGSRASLFAEVGYLYLPSVTFHYNAGGGSQGSLDPSLGQAKTVMPRASRSDNPYKLTERGVFGSVGIRFRFH